MARKIRKAQLIEIDLTPMIDCTFQLLIFFILTMKFKQIERRQGANLPLDEGESPKEAKEVKRLTLRMFWKEGTMTYQVDHNKGWGESSGAARQIIGGTMQALISDRTKDAVPHYQAVHDQLVEAIKGAYAKAAGEKVDKIEVAMAPNTAISSAKQIESTAPWGFVTLAVDACTSFNEQMFGKDRTKWLGITFKDTQAGNANADATRR